MQISHDYINDLVRRLSKYIHVFYNIRNQLPKTTMLSLYHSLVYPNLIYVWGLCMGRLYRQNFTAAHSIT